MTASENDRVVRADVAVGPPRDRNRRRPRAGMTVAGFSLRFSGQAIGVLNLSKVAVAKIIQKQSLRSSRWNRPTLEVRRLSANQRGKRGLIPRLHHQGRRAKSRTKPAPHRVSRGHGEWLEEDRLEQQWEPDSNLLWAESQH